MSTLKVNFIESFTAGNSVPITINDQLRTTPNATPEGAFAVAFGTGNTGSGDNSFTVGQSNLNEGLASMVLGYGNEIFNPAGTYALVGGYQNYLSGSQTAPSVFGFKNTASVSDYTHVEGRLNKALGADYSYVLGSNNTVKQDYCFVAGLGNTAKTYDYQFVIGNYSTASVTLTTASFVVGHGTSGAEKNLIEFNPKGGANSTIIIDETALPTADPGVAGQLYTTGSDLFGGPAALKVLMVST